MIVSVFTASGAHYTFNSYNMQWERYHETVPVHGLRSDHGSNVGILVEWPVIAIGQRIMFDDTKIGTIYTTRVISGFTDIKG